MLAVVPAQSYRATAEAMRGHLRPGSAVVNCAKGIEQHSGLYMREVLADVLPGQPAAALSGPSFAVDLARGLPTAVTLAAGRIELAEELCARLAAPHFRLYRSSDLVGVEIGGAAKNVLAIACGVVMGRELGASAHAALLARGFAELMRFASAQGARPETLMGLSGLGDLALTCSSPQSRNYALGFALGRGEKPQTAGHGKLTEGALTAHILTEKARKLGVEMPIAEAVTAVLENRIEVGAAIEALMSRPFRPRLTPVSRRLARQPVSRRAMGRADRRAEKSYLSSRSAGTLPPLAATRAMTLSCSHMFILALSWVSPSYFSSAASALRAVRLESRPRTFRRSTIETRQSRVSGFFSFRSSRTAAMSTLAATSAGTLAGAPGAGAAEGAAAGVARRRPGRRERLQPGSCRKSFREWS